VAKRPDFWLVECDTFWHDGPPAIACRILAGPARLIAGYDVEQWLVKVDPPVSDHGVVTDRVLVDCHPPDWQDGDDWAVLCTGAYSLAPSGKGVRFWDPDRPSTVGA
jgi:hypothetical protein